VTSEPRPPSLLRRGWEAPFADIALGALAALAVTGPLAVVLQVPLGLGAGAATAVVSQIQLLLGFLAAGWLVSRRENRR
jgi:hypothetical protein